MEGKIGTSAVLYRNGRLKSTLGYQLRLARHHMVYEGRVLVPPRYTLAPHKQGVGDMVSHHLY